MPDAAANRAFVHALMRRDTFGGRVGGAWHAFCSMRRMFLKEALLRCSVLHRETAARFESLRAESTADDARTAAWTGAAIRERRRAELLDALASICSALEDEGPFLVQIPLQLEEVRRALDSLEWRRDTCADHPGCGCGEVLQAVPAARVYADLIELAEPEVRRALRLITNEIRAVRRTAPAATASREPKAAANREPKAVANRELKAVSACAS
jgi:hypothetical protein